MEIIIVLTGIFFMLSPIMEYASSLMQRFINIRFEASGKTHLWYYTDLPQIVKNTSLIHLLFGYGGRNSGYAYSVVSGLRNDIVWDVESTWLQIFWSYGIFGWIYWLRWMINNLFAYYKNDKKCFALFVAVMIGGIGYTLLPNWGLSALLILSCYTSNNNDPIYVNTKSIYIRY